MQGGYVKSQALAGGKLDGSRLSWCILASRDSGLKRAFSHFQNTTPLPIKKHLLQCFLWNFQRKLWGVLPKSLRDVTSLKNPHLQNGGYNGSLGVLGEAMSVQNTWKLWHTSKQKGLWAAVLLPVLCKELRGRNCRQSQRPPKSLCLLLKNVGQAQCTEYGGIFGSTAGAHRGGG